MTIYSQLSYVGADSAGRAVIRMEPKISIQNSENSPQQVNLKSSTGKGSVYFDAARGVIVRSELDLTMEISVQLNGQAIDQKVTQKLAMTLAE
jgi:hypothetical protein